MIRAPEQPILLAPTRGLLLVETHKSTAGGNSRRAGGMKRGMSSDEPPEHPPIVIRKCVRKKRRVHKDANESFDESLSAILAHGNEEDTCKAIGMISSTYGTCKIMTGMYEKAREGKLCDAVFLVGGEECPAHKAALATASDVFESMFTNGMKESRDGDDGPIKVRLGPEVTVDVFRDVLKFVYLGSVEVTSDSVLSLLRVGDMYQVKGLVRAVESLLIKKVCVGNCVGEWRRAVDNNLAGLRRAALECIGENLEKLYSDSGFQHLLQELIMEILMSKAIKNTALKVKAFVSWVLVDQPGRREKCDSMLCLLPHDGLDTREDISSAGIELVKLCSFSERARWMVSFLFKKGARPQMDCVGITNRDSNWIVRDLKSTTHRRLMEFSEEVCGILRCKDEVSTIWISAPDRSFRARIIIHSPDLFGNDLFRSISMHVDNFEVDYRSIVVPLTFRIGMMDNYGRPHFSSIQSAEFRRDAPFHVIRSFISHKKLKINRKGLYNPSKDSVKLVVLLYRR